MNNKLNLTGKELVMLQMMAQNCFAYTNYGVPQEFEDCGELWSNQLDNCTLKDGMEMPPASSFGGIMSSLVKKGLATCEGFGDAEDTCALTEEGFKAWQEQVQNVDFSKETIHMNPLENLNNDQIHIIWEALSQYSENQPTDPSTGDEIENPILDDLIDKLDNYIANA